MDQKAARGAIAKVLKVRGVKARKGRLRLQAGELWWYVGVRAASPAPSAPLSFELGCWVPAIGPEPEGGAVDCPLLLDLPVGEDPVQAANEVVDLMARADGLAALKALIDDHPEALVDRQLRSHLGI